MRFAPWVFPLTEETASAPPRVRGKVSCFQLVEGADGITPACAGKRGTLLQTKRLQKDHPRVCGEKLLLVGLNGFNQGSPPRVRGKASKASSPVSSTRITPACAGKRPSISSPNCSTKDHPRVCGEKADKFFKEIGVLGSPPRVRGKVVVATARPQRPRITPACAGKSTSLTSAM